MSQVKDIMAVFNELMAGSGPILGPKEVEAKISAILSRPQVIVQDGVEWKRTKQVWESRSVYGLVGGVQEINGKYSTWVADMVDFLNIKEMDKYDDFDSALAVATKAVKEGG